MTEHTLRAFDVDIDAMRSSITAMGGLVERQLARAIEAVHYGDLRLVMQVLADEDEVNKLHMESDLRCNQIIAKRQPLAIDLREIIGVIHGINDLERVGDEAKKIALKAQQFEGHDLPVPIEPVLRMADLAGQMLREAIDGFVRQDATVSARLDARDDEVDALRDQLVVQLMKKMTEDHDTVSLSLAMVFVVQSIERIADHAKNLAEYVVNVVHGIDARHSSLGKAGTGVVA